LVREGNSLKYTTSSGDEIKQFRKAWERNEGKCLDTVMNDWENKAAADALSKDAAVSIDSLDHNINDSGDE
jgi:hypothetical protein